MTLKWYRSYTIPVFEFDPDKSVANAAKHGIDFDEAKAIWTDDHRYEVPIRRTEFDEERWSVVGRVGDRVSTAIVTYRGAATRIISVRRARDNEAFHYHSRGI